MELDSNPTTTVTKDQAQPNWAEIGLWTSVLVSVLIGWALWNGVFSEAWTNYLDPKNVDPVPKTEALRNLTWSMGTIGAVFAGFIGLVMAGFRTVALHRQANTAQRESDLNAQKHQSEAFATAIEQLGHENFAVRLGAVYALEALAKSARDLHGPVFETLCTYVREKSPVKKNGTLKGIYGTKDGTPIDIAIEDYLKLAPSVEVVIQSIITVIGRRNHIFDPDHFEIDLSETNLQKVSMCDGRFDHVNLRDADLTGSRIHNASLRGANLCESILIGSSIRDVNFDHSFFFYTQFQGASINNTYFANTILSALNIMSTSVTDSQFINCQIHSWSFNNETDVSGTNFKTSIGIPCGLPSVVQGASTATWSDDDLDAWDRGEE